MVFTLSSQSKGWRFKASQWDFGCPHHMLRRFFQSTCKFLARAPGGCVALAQRRTYCTDIPSMPDCVTAKQQQNTLLFVCVCVCE